jgi:hypothetical protein
MTEPHALFRFFASMRFARAMFRRALSFSFFSTHQWRPRHAR